MSFHLINGHGGPLPNVRPSGDGRRAFGDHDDLEDPFADPPGGVPVVPGVLYDNMNITYRPVRGKYFFQDGKAVHYLAPYMAHPFPEPPKSINQGKQHDDQSKTVHFGDIGGFNIFPGEIRNQLYRDMVVGPHGVVRIEADQRCGRGACVHAQVGGAVHGMASTCQLVRQELMSIYIAENVCFRFGAEAVRNRCTMRWVESLGPFYADQVREVVVEMKVLQNPEPPHLMEGMRKKSTSWIRLRLPTVTKDKKLKMIWGSALLSRLRGKPEMERLDLLIDDLNEDMEFCEVPGRCKMHATSAELRRFLDSDELANVVHRCQR